MPTPRITPAVSIPTSLIPGPRSGTKHCIVSSIHATKKPPVIGQAICSAVFVRSIRTIQLSKPPRQANSVKWANFRRRPWPCSGSFAGRSKIRLIRSFTHRLIAPEMSPGSREFPQIKPIFRHSSTMQTVIRLRFLRITPVPPNAPAKS